MKPITLQLLVMLLVAAAVAGMEPEGAVTLLQYRHEACEHDAAGICVTQNESKAVSDTTTEQPLWKVTGNDTTTAAAERDRENGTERDENLQAATIDILERNAIPSIYVAVLSRYEATDRRQLLREAMAGIAKSKLNITRKFVICRGMQDAPQAKLEHEAAEFGDIDFLNCTEKWTLLAAEVHDIMELYASRYGDRDLFMKMDDDAFVAWNRWKFHLARALARNAVDALPDVSYLYMGLPEHSELSRKPHHKWYTSHKAWPSDEPFPLTMQGSAYLLGRELLRRVLALSRNATQLRHNRERRILGEDRTTAFLVDMAREAGTPVYNVALPGTAGFTSQDVLENSGYRRQVPPIIQSGPWSRYPYCTHHHLSASSIKCLDLLDAADDETALVDSCFPHQLAQDR